MNENSKKRKRAVKTQKNLNVSENLIIKDIDDSEAVHVHVHGVHSEEDSIVYFPKENMLYTGALFQKTFEQNIDDVIKALGYVLYMSDDQTKILPGFGMTIRRDELEDFKDWIESLKAKVKSMKNKAVPLDEVQAHNLATEWQSIQRLFSVSPDELINCIYRSV